MPPVSAFVDRVAWFRRVAVFGLLGLVAVGCGAAPEVGTESAAPEALAAVVPVEVDGPLAIADDEGEDATAVVAVDGWSRAAATASIIGSSVVGLPPSVPIDDDVTIVAAMPEGLATIDAWAEPATDGEPDWVFDRIDEFSEPRVFRVLDRVDDLLHVQLPTRPNGTTGWIRADDVELSETRQRILIDLSERSVVVWDGDEVVMDTTGTIGASTTPTPTGSFYVRNAFEWYPDSVYGPWVIPLSAYSEAIDVINGGEAVVAIHGTRRPDLVGEAASLGCVRLPNDIVTQLGEMVEPGAPVEIVP